VKERRGRKRGQSGFRGGGIKGRGKPEEKGKRDVYRKRKGKGEHDV